MRILLLLLLSSIGAQAATTQLNALSWCRADGSDQTSNMQQAVNAAVTAGYNLYVPPGIVYEYSLLTNTTGLLMEDYTTQGRIINRGTVEVSAPGLSSYDWTINTPGIIRATNILNGPLNVAELGARLDGVTDDTAVVQMGLDMMSDAGGGSMYFPPGNCVVMADLRVPDNVHMYGSYGSRLVFSDALITNACILIQGSLTALPNLASPVAKHATTLTLASSPGLSANDVVVLWNTNEFSYSPFRSYYYEGEYCLVRVASGANLTLSAPTYAAYEVADTKVYRLNGTRTRISSLEIVGKNGDQVPVIKVQYGRDFAFDDLELSGSEYTQILVSHSYSGIISKCNAVDYSVNVGVNYGALIGNSQRIIVSGCQFLTSRHGLSFGGNDTTASVPCRQLIVDGNIIGSVGNIYGLNLHGNCADFIISDNDLPNAAEFPDRGIVRGNRVRASNNNRYALTDNAELIGNDIRIEGNEIEAVADFNEGLVKWTSVSNCLAFTSPVIINNTIRTWGYARSDYPSSPTDVIRVTMAAGGQTNCWPTISGNKIWTTESTVGDYYLVRILTASTNAGFVGVTIENNELWGGGIGLDANVKYANVNGNDIYASLGAGIDVRFNANPQMTNQIWNVNDNLVTLANKSGVKMTPDAQAEVYAHRNTLRHNARTHVGSNLDTGFYVGQGSLVDFEWNKLTGSAPQTNLYTLAATTVIHRNNIELGMTDKVVSATTNLTFSASQIAFQHPALGLRGDSAFNWFSDTTTFGIGTGIGAGIAGYRVIVNDSANSTRRVLFANDAASGNTAAAFSLDMRVGGGVSGASGGISINPWDFAADTAKQARLNFFANSTATNGIAFHLPNAGMTTSWYMQGIRQMRLADDGTLFLGNGSGTNVLAFMNAAESFGFYLDGYNGGTGDTTLTNTFGGGTGYKLSSGAHRFYGNNGLMATLEGSGGATTLTMYDSVASTSGFFLHQTNQTTAYAPWLLLAGNETLMTLSSGVSIFTPGHDVRIHGYNPENTDGTSYLSFAHPGTNFTAQIRSVGTGVAGTAKPVQVVFDSTPKVTFTSAATIILAEITRAQRDAITPTNGMIVMQSDDTAGPRVYTGGAWYSFDLTADP